MKYIFGIQGGKGSFNEEALADYVKRHNLSDFKVKYLYTSENVLRSLNTKSINRGLFAIYNSAGGVVDESVIAMGKYNFKLTEDFAIEITHHLMKRKDVDIDEITSIMAHPQVFRQCAKSLSQKYPHLKQVTGSGDMIDNGRIALALFNKEIPANTAILMSKINSQIYDFDIVESNLQDLKKNMTSFLMVK